MNPIFMQKIFCYGTNFYKIGVRFIEQDRSSPLSPTKLEALRNGFNRSPALFDKFDLIVGDVMWNGNRTNPIRLYWNDATARYVIVSGYHRVALARDENIASVWASVEKN